MSLVKPALRALERSPASGADPTQRASIINRIRARLTMQELSEEEVDLILAQMRSEAIAKLDTETEDSDLDEFIAQARKKRALDQKGAAVPRVPSNGRETMSASEADNSRLEAGASTGARGELAWQGVQPGPTGLPSATPCKLPQFIEIKPQSLTLIAGNKAAFYGHFTGASELRWYREEMPISDVGAISGSRSPQLTLNQTQPSDAGRYRLVAKNNCGLESTTWVRLELNRCIIDFNQDGVVNANDRAAFLSAWENGESSADANYDGGTDGQDYEYYERQYPTGGCFNPASP